MNIKHVIYISRKILTNKSYYIAVLGIVFSLFFSLESFGIERGVLDTYISSKYSSGYVLSYSFAAYCCALVFCQDIEYKFIYYIVTRIGLKKYVIQRSLYIFICSFLVTVFGVILFALICRIKLPWIVKDSGAYSFLIVSVFGKYILQERYFLFLFLNSLYMGLFSGLLSLLAATFSLYITNRIMVLSFPLFITQTLFIMASKISIPNIFEKTIASFQYQLYDILIPLIFSLFVFLLSTYVIYYLLKKRL